MTRIKGANSDYKYSLKDRKIIEVSPKPDPLYLKIFICPYDQPGSIDEREKEDCCQGSDSHCPSVEQKKGKGEGHALVELHQKEGVKLIADHQTQLVLDQKGSINLSPSQQQGFEGKVNVNGSLSVTGETSLNTVNFSKELCLKTPSSTNPVLKLSSEQLEINLNNSSTIKINSNQVEVSLKSGAKISIDSEGNIELSPATAKVVRIKGDLTVTGKIDGTPSDALKQKIKT